jgi:hypothetical protein
MIAPRLYQHFFCDRKRCERSEVIDTSTVADANAEAVRCGWAQIGKRRWLCPDCADKAEQRAAVDTAVNRN